MNSKVLCPEPTTSDWLEILGDEKLLKLILKSLNFFAIQRLQIVSEDIWSIINKITPDPCFSGLYLHQNPLGITANVELASGEFEFENFKDFQKFQNFLKSSLKVQKSKMEDLEFIDLEPIIFESIGNVLKSRDTWIRVEELMFCVKNDDGLIKILPFIDKNFIKSIRFDGRSSSEDQVLSLDNCCKLDQWKNTDELMIRNFIVITPIQSLNITNFINLEITIDHISSDDIFYLKEVLLESLNLQKWKILFKSSTINDTINYLLGNPYHFVDGISSIWYFYYPDPNHALQIRYVNDKAVLFTRVLTNDIG